MANVLRGPVFVPRYPVPPRNPTRDWVGPNLLCSTLAQKPFVALDTPTRTQIVGNYSRDWAPPNLLLTTLAQGANSTIPPRYAAEHGYRPVILRQNPTQAWVPLNLLLTTLGPAAQTGSGALSYALNPAIAGSGTDTVFSGPSGKWRTDDTGFIPIVQKSL